MSPAAILSLPRGKSETPTKATATVLKKRSNVVSPTTTNTATSATHSRLIPNIFNTKHPLPVPPTPRSALAYIRDNATERGGHQEQSEEANKLYRETVDPFLRDRPKQQFTCLAWLALPIVSIICWIVMIICLGIDRLDSGWQYVSPAGEKLAFPQWWHYDLKSFFWTMLNPVPAHSRNLMHAVIPSMMFLFGMLVTFIGIVLQFAGKKTTSHVNSLVVKDPFILSIIGGVIISGSFQFSVVQSIGSPNLPKSTNELISNSSSSSFLPFIEPFLSSSSSTSTSEICPISNSSCILNELTSSTLVSTILSSFAGNTSSSSIALETDSLMAGPSMYPRFAIIICVLGVSFTTVLFVPFALYLMTFLDSDNVITEIMTKGLNAFVSSINKQDGDLQFHRHMQQRTNNALKYLMDTAESAMNEFNNNLCSEALDAMCSYAMNYLTLKRKAPQIWFTIPKWIRLSTDFLFLNEESLRDITTRGTWFEWKVLRQFQSVFVQCLALEKRELCYHCCINSRIIGETAGALNEIHSVDLCLKFFNTYLRMAINSNDVRVCYNTLFQYRQMAERFIDRERGANKELALRAWKTAKFMLYYAFACQQKRLFFLVETVAQDMRVLCQIAMASAQQTRSVAGTTTTSIAGRAGLDPERAVFREVHDKLLQVLLNLSDIAEGTGSKRGVSRALGILAASYLKSGQEVQARKVSKAFARESREYIISLREELLSNIVKEFWEISERGENFTYLSPELHKPLCSFFDICLSQTTAPIAATTTATTNQPTDFWQTPEGKKLRIDQELMNFKTGMSDDEDLLDIDDEDEEGCSISNSGTAPLLFNTSSPQAQKK